MRAKKKEREVPLSALQHRLQNILFERRRFAVRTRYLFAAGKIRRRFARAYENGAVRERIRFLHVVRDKDDRSPVAFPQFAENFRQTDLDRKSVV